MRSFSKLYGASPVHLLAAGGAFAIAAYAAFRIATKQPPLPLAKWFVGAILSHDVVLLPIYTVALIALLYLVGGRAARQDAPLARTRLLVLNHVRVPAALSVLALLLFFPLVLGLSAAGYEGVSGLSTDPYGPRFLFLTLGLFVVSGLILVVRLALGSRGRASPSAGGDESAAR